MSDHTLISLTIFTVLFIFAVAALVIQHIQSKSRVLSDNEVDYVTYTVDRIKNYVENSGSGIPYTAYIAMTIGLPLLSFMCLLIFFNEPVGGLILAVLMAFIPSLLVRVLGKHQKDRFDERYARALKSLSSDLQAGMSIQQAVEEITTNHFIHKSIRRGFEQISADIRTGLSVSLAFERFAQEYKSQDSADVAAAISMQAEVGGSEAQIIELVSANIRNRIMLRKEIKTLFADVSILVNFMDVLPFLIVALLYFMARDIIQPFFESVPMLMVFIGLMLFTLIGSYFIRKKMKETQRGNV